MRTDNGRDFEALVLSGPSGATGLATPATYIAFSADTTPPAATDSSLLGEITGGPLARQQATYAHTEGTNTYTLTVNTVSDRPITIFKAAVFNAPAGSGGTMVYETELATPAPLLAGSSFVYTEIINL